MEDTEPARIQTEIKSAQKFSRNNKAKSVNYASKEQDMVTQYKLILRSQKHNLSFQ